MTAATGEIGSLHFGALYNCAFRSNHLPARISRLLTVLVVLASFWMVNNHAASGAMSRLLLALEVLIASLFLLLHYFPDAVHLGWRRVRDFPPRQQLRAEALLQDALGLMGLLFAVFFAGRIRLILLQAPAAQASEAARVTSAWLTGGLVIGELLIVLYYQGRLGTLDTSDPG
jgi:hypothetical protein